MAELADASDLGSGGYFRAGSSPAIPTIYAGVTEWPRWMFAKHHYAGSNPVTGSIFYLLYIIKL